MLISFDRSAWSVSDNMVFKQTASPLTEVLDLQLTSHRKKLSTSYHHHHHLRVCCFLYLDALSLVSMHTANRYLLLPIVTQQLTQRLGKKQRAHFSVCFLTCTTWKMYFFYPKAGSEPPPYGKTQMQKFYKMTKASHLC